MAALFDTTIVGGDTTSWDGPLVINVAIAGEVASGSAVTRSGATPGDWVFVTGSLGGSIKGHHLDFTPRVEHAGYPGVLHGGVVGAALDEAMFWAATHGVSRMHLSAELTVRYRKKVEVGCSYRLVARIVKAARSMCRTEAELLDADGEVCANATGKYLPLPKEDADLVLQDFHADDSTVPLERYLDNRD